MALRNEKRPDWRKKAKPARMKAVRFVPNKLAKSREREPPAKRSRSS
jgi:hypothetical protein